MSYLMPKLETPIKVRVRGKDNGGWKGDPQWIGFITFTGKLTETGMPSIMKINIGGLPGQMYLSSIRRPSSDDSPDDLWIGVDGWPEDGHMAHPTMQFEFVVHREWAHCFEPAIGEQISAKPMLGEGTSVGEIVNYAAESKPEPVVEKKAKTVQWSPNEKEQGFIRFWESMLDFRNYHLDPVYVLTIAVAVIREAIRRTKLPHTDIDRAVDFPRVVSSRALIPCIQTILDTTGLAPYAILGYRNLSFGTPTPEGSYGWGRAVEQIGIMPLETLKLEVRDDLDHSRMLHLTGNPDIDLGLKEALEVCKSLDDKFGSPKKG